jgi:hypothetical protein
VLAAWASNPPVLQTSHCKPLGEDNIPENVEVTYSVEIGGQRRALAIGEMKRNLVHAASWQGGDLSRKSSQKRLSQELRGSVTFLPLSPLPSRRRKERSGPGIYSRRPDTVNSYACKYQCPQVFCFDGATMIILQFRAQRLERMEDEDCPVDCWVLPLTSSYCTLRYALYRLLVQGLRRCLGNMAGQLAVAGLIPDFREFYNARPLWRVGQVTYDQHPGGYTRAVEATTGMLKWVHDTLPEVVEVGPFWSDQHGEGAAQ